MAVEVQAGVYIYLGHGNEAFAHNPLHDLESLWWVGLWILLCHYHPDNLQDTAVQQHIEVVEKFGETLFDNCAYSSGPSRRRALTGLDLLRDTMPLVFPKAVQRLIFLLDVFRAQLVTHYKLYKPMAFQDRSFFTPDLYSKFSDKFEETMKVLKDDQTELWLFTDIKDQIDYLNGKK